MNQKLGLTCDILKGIKCAMSSSKVGLKITNNRHNIKITAMKLSDLRHSDYPNQDSGRKRDLVRSGFREGTRLSGIYDLSDMKGKCKKLFKRYFL